MWGRRAFSGGPANSDEAGFKYVVISTRMWHDRAPPSVTMLKLSWTPLAGSSIVRWSLAGCAAAALLLGAAWFVAAEPASGGMAKWRVFGRSPALSYRLLQWPELGPEWDPLKRAQATALEARTWVDADPRAKAALRELRELAENAPVNSALDNSKVRISGYVVPLEMTRAGVKDFLLVPYFGACIHTPPPPSNQIVHVTAAKPIEFLYAMAKVSVGGHLFVKQTDSTFGSSGYALAAEEVTPYAGPDR